MTVDALSTESISRFPSKYLLRNQYRLPYVSSNVLRRSLEHKIDETKDRTMVKFEQQVGICCSTSCHDLHKSFFFK